MTIEKIQKCRSANELFTLVHSYLVQIGEWDAALTESWEDTAKRLNSEILYAAYAKLFELEKIVQKVMVVGEAAEQVDLAVITVRKHCVSGAKFNKMDVRKVEGGRGEWLITKPGLRRAYPERMK